MTKLIVLLVLSLSLAKPEGLAFAAPELSFQVKNHDSDWCVAQIKRHTGAANYLYRTDTKTVLGIQGRQKNLPAGYNLKVSWNSKRVKVSIIINDPPFYGSAVATKTCSP